MSDSKPDEGDVIFFGEPAMAGLLRSTGLQPAPPKRLIDMSRAEIEHDAYLTVVAHAIVERLLPPFMDGGESWRQACQATRQILSTEFPLPRMRETAREEKPDGR